MGEPETLDWNRAHTSIETYLLMNLMEGLVGLDSKLQIVPALAKSWTVSSDGRTYVFELRSGARWSDGVELRAQDFVTSWKRLLSPHTAATSAYFLYDIEGAQAYNQGKLTDFSKVGVAALDDRHLRVKLIRRVTHWLSILSFWATFPLRRDVLDKYGTSWEAPGNMVTVGPYCLESHELESKIVLRPNPFYYRERGNIDRIVGLIVKDDATALKLYEVKKLDFLTDIPILDLQRLKKRRDLRVFSYLKTVYLGFSIHQFPTSDVRLRRAIAMAIDKTQFQEFLQGEQQPASSFVPPPLEGFSSQIGFKFDLKQAMVELATLKPPIRFPIKIDLIIPNTEKAALVGQYLQEELKKNLGLDVVLQPFDHKTFRSRIDLQTYPQYLLSWSADYPDPDNFISIFTGDSGNNHTGWKSSQYDQKVIQARQMNQSPRREALYFELQKNLLEEQAVIIPLYYEPNLVLVSPRVKGFELNPINYLEFRKVNLVPN